MNDETGDTPLSSTIEKDESSKPPPTKKVKTDSSSPGLTPLVVTSASSIQGSGSFVGGINLTISNGRVISNNGNSPATAVTAKSTIQEPSKSLIATTNAVSKTTAVQFMPSSVIKMAGNVAALNLQPVILQNPGSFLVPTNITQPLQAIRLAHGPICQTTRQFSLLTSSPSYSKPAQSLLNKNSKLKRPSHDFLQAVNIRPTKSRPSYPPVKIAPAIVKDVTDKPLSPPVTVANTKQSKPATCTTASVSNPTTKDVTKQFTPIIFAPVTFCSSLTSTVSSLSTIGPVSSMTSVSGINTNITSPAVQPGSFVFLPLSFDSQSLNRNMAPTMGLEQTSLLINKTGDENKDCKIGDKNSDSVISSLQMQTDKQSKLISLVNKDSSTAVNAVSSTKPCDKNMDDKNNNFEKTANKKTSSNSATPKQIQISFNLKTGHVENTTLLEKVPIDRSLKSGENNSSNNTRKKNESEEKTEDNDENNDDPMSLMEWENGIGHLPGSDLKFRMNEFGVYEMITDIALDSAPHVPSSRRNNDLFNEKLDVIPSPQDLTMKSIIKIESDDLSIEEKGSVLNNHPVVKRPTYEKVRSKKKSVANKVVEGKGVKEQTNLKTTNKKSILVKDLIKKRKKKGSVSDHRSSGFSWTDYLKQEAAILAPTKLFNNPFPQTRTALKAGMKLEGIGPHNQSRYSVLTIAETRGYRVRLHYDEESEVYDYWVNADSPNIFPVGWCEKNNKSLTPPKSHSGDVEFNWGYYLRDNPAQIVNKNQLAHNLTTAPSTFKIGQKLEAVDKKNSALTCVATVADTIGERILVHFDGWEKSYDYWCDISSPYIHPVGWCQDNGRLLTQPADWNEDFYWDTYMKICKATAVPARHFKPRQPLAFTEGMNIEIVDKRNPILVRVATIISILDYRIKVHFDGWDSVYDYWIDDDDHDLHPPEWCMRTGHPLMPPLTPQDLVVDPDEPGCPTPGCKGIGHIKGAKFTGHHSAFGCPYSPINLEKENSNVTTERYNNDIKSPTSHESSLVCPPISHDQDQPMDVSTDEEPIKVSNSRSTTPSKTSHRVRPPTQPSNTQKHKDPPAGDKPKRGRKPKSFLHWREKKEKEEKERETIQQLHLGIHQSVFMSAAVTPPEHTTQPYGWSQHTKLLPGVSRYDGNDVIGWNVDDVAVFIKTLLGSQDYSQKFRDHEIDGEAFLLLTQSDLVNIMNIKLGPAVKIYNSVIVFKTSQDV